MSITLKADLVGAYLKRDLISHTRKVQSLYKRMARNEWANHDEPASYRIAVTMLRARFEENRHVKDMRVAKQLLAQGEQELWDKLSWKPRYFRDSPGGVCFERYVYYNDLHLDQWHPLEKARYPHYMAKREQLKKEYIEMWEKEYGKPTESDAH